MGTSPTAVAAKHTTEVVPTRTVAVDSGSWEAKIVSDNA